MIVTLPALCTGVIALMLVEPFTVTLTAGVVSNFTEAPFTKFVPVITTTVPPAVVPLVGMNELIVGGAAAACTMKSPTMSP